MVRKNLSSTISPILRNYLHNSRNNPSSQNKRKLTKDSNAQPKVKITTKLNKRNFEEMTLEELQKEVVNKGIKLDKRNGKKTLISLLLKLSILKLCLKINSIIKPKKKKWYNIWESSGAFLQFQIVQKTLYYNDATS